MKFKKILNKTNLGLTCAKYLTKIIFDMKIEIGIFEISIPPNFNQFEYCNFGINLSLTGGKYLIKIIFDIKIEAEIFKISNEPNFNKS